MLRHQRSSTCLPNKMLNIKGIHINTNTPAQQLANTKNIS